MEYSFQALNENYWEEIQKMIYIIHPKEHNFRERPYPCEFPGCVMCFRNRNESNNHFNVHKEYSGFLPLKPKNYVDEIIKLGESNYNISNQKRLIKTNTPKR